MYVFDIANVITKQTDIITGKTINDISGEILHYDNGAKCDKTIDYTVNFYDSKGDIVLTIPESGLTFAIFGADEDTNSNISESMKEYSQKYWEMNHKKIQIIEFDNPSHPGEAIWDPDYNPELEIDQDSDEDYNPEDDAEDAEDAENEEYDFDTTSNKNILSA
jgi:hypothetical protein